MHLGSLAVLAVLLPVHLCTAATRLPESAATCQVDMPPPTAGEGASHRQLFKVHPRKSEVGASFTGCQTMWVFKPGELEVLGAPESSMRIYFRSSHPIAVQIDKLLCLYPKGLASPKNPDSCPKTVVEPMPSQPAGCLTATASSTKANMLCDYD